MTIDQIRQPVANEFNLFLEEYRRRTQSDVELLEQVVEYLSHFPGKQLRPLLVLLAACETGHGSRASSQCLPYARRCGGRVELSTQP